MYNFISYDIYFQPKDREFESMLEPEKGLNLRERRERMRLGSNYLELVLWKYFGWHHQWVGLALVGRGHVITL